MSQGTQLSVPRYVYKSVERALSTAKQRVRSAQERVDQLESALESMRVGSNGAGHAANDNSSKSEAQEG